MSIRSSLNIMFFILSFFLAMPLAVRTVHAQEMEPRALFEKRCSKCHSLDKTNRTESADYWKSTVNKMKKKFFSGISEEDAAVITEYLIKTKGLPESAQKAAPDDTNDK